MNPPLIGIAALLAGIGLAALPLALRGLRGRRARRATIPRDEAIARASMKALPAGDPAPGTPGEAPAGGGRDSYRKGLSYGALSFVTSSVLAVVTGIVIARLYGIEVVGQFALVMAPVSAMWFLSSAREQAALVRELATIDRRQPAVTGLFTAIFAFSTLLTAVVAALVMGAVYLLYHGPVDQPGLIVPASALMLGYVLLANPGWNIDALLSAYRAGPQMFVARTSEALAYLVAGVAGGLVSGSVWAITLATLVGYVVSLALRLFMLPRFMAFRVPAAEIRAGFRALPRMIGFGLKMAPGQIAEGVNNEASIWILGALQPVATVGAYSRAWGLAGRIRAANYRITELLFPTLVERRHSGDAEGFDRAVIDSMRYAWMLMLIPAAVAGGAASGVMSIYGPGFDQAGAALALLLLLPPLSATTAMFGHVLNAHDRPLTGSYIAMGRTVVALPLIAMFTVAWGITGAALAIVTSYLLSVGIEYLVTRRHLSRDAWSLWSPRAAGAQVAAYAAGFGTAWYSERLFDALWGLTIALPAGFIAYCATLYIGGGFNARDRARGRDILRRAGRFGPLRRAGAVARTAAGGVPAAALFAAVVAVAVFGGALAATRPAFAVLAIAGVALAALLLWNLRVAVVVFIALQFFAVIPIGEGQLSLVKAAGALIVITWIVTLVNPREREAARAILDDSGPVVLALAAFLALGAASAVWAADAGAVIFDLQRFTLNAILMLVVFAAAMTIRDARVIAGAIALSGAAAVVGGMLFAVQGGKAGRFVGTVGEANELAVQLIPPAFLAIALAFTARSGRHRALFATAAALAVAGIVLSLSRGGALALVAALVVFVVFGGRWRGRALRASLAMAAVALSAFLLLAPAEERTRLLEAGGRDTSSGRSDLWTVGLRAFADDPIVGAGLGNFRTVAPDFVLEPGQLLRTELIIDSPTLAHNVYLGLAVELGLVGLLLFLAVAGGALFAAAAAARRFATLHEPGAEIVARATVAAIAGYLVAATFISLQFQNMLWIMLGLALALHTIARRRARDAAIESPLEPRNDADRPPGAAVVLSSRGWDHADG